jgi:hypothetical protein
MIYEEKFPGNEAAFAELVTFVKEGSVVGLTGAGVSSPLFPTWITLLNGLLDDAVSKGLVADEAIIGEYRGQIEVDPLEFANSLEELYTRKIFRAKFANIFSNSKGQCTPSHEALAALKLRGIVTLTPACFF